MQHRKDHSLYFLLFCLAVSLVLVYWVLQPFFGPLILGAVFAFLFYPIYLRVLRALISPTVAAFVTTLIAIALVLLPLALLGTQILKESSQLYQGLVAGGAGGFISLVEQGLSQLRIVLPIPTSFKPDFGSYAQQALEVLIQNLGAISSSLAKMLLNLFVFLAAFYFFLKDGPRLKDYLIDMSPLDDSDDERIVARLRRAVSAAVKGTLAIGLIQGFLSFVGFTLFGVPNPALWGAAAALAAFVPGIGTTLVVAPAILFLFFTGHTLAALGLLLWGVTAVGLIDNLLGPKLVGAGMHLHPLAVFLSVLGGLAFFGPLGFILGPLVLSITLALLDIYASLETKYDQH